MSKDYMKRMLDSALDVATLLRIGYRDSKSIIDKVQTKIAINEVEKIIISMYKILGEDGVS